MSRSKPIEIEETFPVRDPIEEKEIIPRPLGSSRLDRITQADLKELHDLGEAKTKAIEKFDLKLREIQHKIIKGATVEQGPRRPGKHYFQLNERTTILRRHPSYKTALIDAKGEQYQLRVLERTPATGYVRVRLKW